jgi:hypothetical protein
MSTSHGRIANPHYPSAPARMADGRLFTDYRPSCTLLPPLIPNRTWAGIERRDNMKATGETLMAMDRYATVSRAGQLGVVDTMVPELYKTVYAWDGGAQLMSHPVGIGTGRLYLPGRAAELVGADPDVVATATFPQMGGAFPSYVEGAKAAAGPVATVKRNRYSAPHA